VGEDAKQNFAVVSDVCHSLFWRLRAAYFTTYKSSTHGDGRHNSTSTKALHKHHASTMDGLSSTSAESRHGSKSVDLSPRRFRALGAFSLLVGVFFYPNLLHINSAEDATTSTSFSDVNSTQKAPVRDDLFSLNSTMEESDAPTEMKVTASSRSTCQVPNTDSDKAPKLASSTTATIFSKCSRTMGKHLAAGREELVANLPMNPRAHIFSFPTNVRNEQGQPPLLCVPQKNGNKQFGGFMYAAWNNKPAIDGYGVDSDMSHWDHHQLPDNKESKKSHVYFVARNPYTRILSLYLQKVVNACISVGQKGCDRHGWKGMNSKRTSFKDFVKRVAEKAETKGSTCAYNVHLCQQVESSLTATLAAKDVTIIRLEEQSCWVPCLVKQIGVKSALLSKGWEAFSGSSCYYTATGDCSDMLRSIDPSKVGVTTGNVHATGASNKFAEYYDAETAAIVSRLYADDFRILGYPILENTTTGSMF